MKENVSTQLVQCPACGGSVSSKAKSCPHCAHPIRRLRLIKEFGRRKDASVEKARSWSLIGLHYVLRTSLYLIVFSLIAGVASFVYFLIEAIGADGAPLIVALTIPFFFHLPIIYCAARTRHSSFPRMLCKVFAVMLLVGAVYNFTSDISGNNKFGILAAIVNIIWAAIIFTLRGQFVPAKPLRNRTDDSRAFDASQLEVKQ